MNINTIIFSLLLSISASLYSYDPIQEAILSSDYDAFTQNYNPKEIPVNTQHSYWALADDTAKNRSAHLAFDWFKAFASKKLIISAALTTMFWGSFDLAYRQHHLKKENPDLNLFPNERPFEAMMGSVMFLIPSFSFFLWAVIDGNKYYKQLQEKIKDAERIKFLIMNS